MLPVQAAKPKFQFAADAAPDLQNPGVAAAFHQEVVELQILVGRHGGPSEAIFDSRTLQSTPEKRSLYGSTGHSVRDRPDNLTLAYVRETNEKTDAGGLGVSS